MAAEHDLDAHLQLRTDDAKIVGTLFIGPKAPTSEITAHVLSVYLQARGVAERLIDQDALLALAEEVKAHPGAEHASVVAHGKPPRHGSPRVVAWEQSIVDRIAEIEASSADDAPPTGSPAPRQPDGIADGNLPNQDPDQESNVDHYGHSSFIIVEADDALGTITPADPGEDGENIFGDAIPAKQSPTPSYLDTESLELTDDNRVLARNCGHFIYSGSKLSVERTLDVKGDVGFATGHVVFPGPVVVQGGVKDRFRIQSAGDTAVQKLVEAATIQASRDIIVARGVAGREAATLQAGRDVKAGYLEAPTVFTQRDCIVQREITNCTITARGSVIITNGAIRGGHVVAANRVEAGIVGSAQEVPTEISLGSIPELDLPLARIRSLHLDAERQRAQLTLKLEATRSAMETPNPKTIEKMMGMEFEIQELAGHIKRLEAAAERIRSNLRANTDPSLLVSKRAHAGTIVRIRGHLIRFKDDLDGPFTLRINNKQQPIIDTHGNERPASEVANVTPDERLDTLAPQESPDQQQESEPAPPTDADRQAA